MSQNDSGYIFDIKRYAIHDGPGIRTTVFFKGCPLKCRWCHNPEGIHFHPDIIYRADKCSRCKDCIDACPEEAIGPDISSVDQSRCCLCGTCAAQCVYDARELSGRLISAGKLFHEIEKDHIFYDESGGGVTFSGGEPLSQPFFLAEVLKKCKEADIHTAVDTSGYCAFTAFELILPYVDLFLYDLKIINEKMHLAYTGVPNTLIKENLEKLTDEDCDFIVRIPVIPEVTDTEENIGKTIMFLAGLNMQPAIHLLPYHTMGYSKFARIGMQDMNIQEFDKGGCSIEDIKNTFEQNGFAAKIGG